MEQLITVILKFLIKIFNEIIFEWNNGKLENRLIFIELTMILTSLYYQRSK